jgi:hypothetical protein
VNESSLNWLFADEWPAEISWDVARRQTKRATSPLGDQGQLGDRQSSRIRNVWQE